MFKNDLWFFFSLLMLTQFLFSTRAKHHKDFLSIAMLMEAYDKHYLLPWTPSRGVMKPEAALARHLGETAAKQEASVWDQSNQ